MAGWGAYLYCTASHYLRVFEMQNLHELGYHFDIEALYQIVSVPLSADSSRPTIVAISHTPICLCDGHIGQTNCQPYSSLKTLRLLPSLLIPSFNDIIPTSWTATPSSRSPLRRWTSSTLWRRSNERKVYLNSLIQQLRVVRSINCSSSFVQGWIFNQRVTLCNRIVSLTQFEVWEEQLTLT
jgi:hypothetical protein